MGDTGEENRGSQNSADNVSHNPPPSLSYVVDRCAFGGPYPNSIVSVQSATRLTKNVRERQRLPHVSMSAGGGVPLYCEHGVVDWLVTCGDADAPARAADLSPLVAAHVEPQLTSAQSPSTETAQLAAIRSGRYLEALRQPGQRRTVGEGEGEGSVDGDGLDGPTVGAGVCCGCLAIVTSTSVFLSSACPGWTVCEKTLLGSCSFVSL